MLKSHGRAAWIARPAVACMYLTVVLALVAAGCGNSTSVKKSNTNPEARSGREAQQLLHSMAAQARSSREPGGSVSILLVEHASGFMDAGAPHAFALVVPSETRYVVRSNSAAHVSARFTGRWYFANAMARRHWEAAGKPAFPKIVTGTRSARIPAGGYSFLPVGPTLTFREAEALPSSAVAVRHAVEKYLRRYKPKDRPAMVLRAFGYLLATAPLRAATRIAIYEAMAKLPGVHSEGAGHDQLGRPGVRLVVNSSDQSIEVLVNPKRAAVYAVSERVYKLAPVFPTLSVGDLVEQTTFAVNGA
jgi:hypothetical protein